MATLAGDVDVDPAGGIAVGSEVVVLLQMGGMAARALIVPGLVASGPMETIAGTQGLAWVKGKPALPTLLLRTAVPCNPKCLIAAARKGNQILLERIDAEGVVDFIIVQRAVRSLGPRHELVAIAGECRRHVMMGQRYVGEIAEDRGGIRLLHGKGMMRSLPALGRRHMAPGTSGCSDECGRSICLRCRFAEWKDTNPANAKTMAMKAGNRMKSMWRNS